MALTGVTWLTGEVIDAARLNYMVDNSTYAKSLFTSTTPWSAASWTSIGWVDISPRWDNDQVIDATRMNQMYRNQDVMKSLIGSGMTIWNEPTSRYQDQFNDDYFQWEFYLTINGTQVGRSINSVWWNFNQMVRYNVANIELNYPDYTVLDLGFKLAANPTAASVKFIKLPHMKYISYWVSLGPNADASRSYMDDLLVVAHSDSTNW